MSSANNGEIIRMPFTLESKELPTYVTKLPRSIMVKWIAIFNKVEEDEGKSMALVVANKWLKRQIKRSSVEGKTDKAYFIERIHLQLSDNQLIKKTEAGEEYIDFVLTDLGADSRGDMYPEELVQKWTKQANEQSFVGDIDHKEYDDIVSQSSTIEQAAELIKSAKRGIAKTVKAVFDKGKMWVRAIIDKRYKKLIEKAKGVSLEAIVTRDADGKIIDGDLLGFTFAVEQNPVNPRAVIA